MPKGLQHKGIVRRNKMLYAAVQLFLKNGYEKTTTASIARAAGMVLMIAVLAGSLIRCSLTAHAASETTYSNAAQIAQIVFQGYNGGTYGPITVTKGTWSKGSSSRTVYLVTMSGTETVSNQTTGYLTDALAGFNLNNKYYSNVVSVIMTNIPVNSNLILAGHSLGGMVAQQVAADSRIKTCYNVMNTVIITIAIIARINANFLIMFIFVVY